MQGNFALGVEDDKLDIDEREQKSVQVRIRYNTN